MWYSNDVFRYTFKAEFVAHVSLKVPSGHCRDGGVSSSHAYRMSQKKDWHIQSGLPDFF